MRHAVVQVLCPYLKCLPTSTGITFRHPSLSAIALLLFITCLSYSQCHTKIVLLWCIGILIRPDIDYSIFPRLLDSELSILEFYEIIETWSIEGVQIDIKVYMKDICVNNNHCWSVKHHQNIESNSVFFLLQQKSGIVRPFNHYRITTTII